MIFEPADSALTPPQRAAFAEALSSLFACAGDPQLKKVVASAFAAQRQRDPRARAVTVQRVSDWRRGSRVPHRFESIDPVLRVLIGEAQRRNSPPAASGIYDIGQWQRWWKEARTASAADTADESPALNGGPSTTCPYQGLASFTVADSGRFFGRARSTNQLVALINNVQDTRPGIVLLTGPSGAGKSSLLSAGLVAAVHAGALHRPAPGGQACASGSASDSGWVWVRFTPGADPVGELQRCLEQPGAENRAEDVRILVIIDQGEELFAPGVSAQSQAEFVRTLHTMCQPSSSSPGAVVVMGLRCDALDRCVELPELADAMQSRLMVLGAMTTAELRDVVIEPAKAAGLRIEPGLVDFILNDLGVEENSAETARLPLLSHALAGTWARRQVGRLTLAGYRSAGGIRGSVAATGEHAWNQLDDAQRAIAERMLLRLVTIGELGHDSCRRQPRQVLLDGFPDTENAADVLETLTAARLLTLHGGDVVFTHEVVLRAWPRLAAWIDGDRAHAPIRQRAEEDAAAWINHDRDGSFLQSGTRLADTLAWLDVAHDANSSVVQFAAASLRRSRQVTRAVRTAAVLLLVLGIVAAAVAVIAINQRKAIARQYDDAVFSQVLAAADERQFTDPSLAAQLVVVAQRMRPNDQVRSRLLATQNAPLATPLTGHTGDVHSVAFNPDGNLLASAGSDHTVRLWDTSDASKPKQIGQPLRGHTSSVTSIAFSPDGKTLASSSDDKTVRLWDVSTPAEAKARTAPLTSGSALYMVAFSPDGHTLAAAGNDRTVQLWDITDPRAARSGPALSGHTGPVRAIAFSPNGHTLASASNDKNVRLWDVTDPGHPRQAGQPLTGFTNPAYAVAFNRTSSLLAASGEDGVVRLWDVTDPFRPAAQGGPLRAHTEPIRGLTFSPDGTTLASASYGGTAKLWNILDPSRPIPLGQPLSASGGLTTMTYRPDGRYVVTAGTAGVIQLWMLPIGLVPNHVGRINALSFSADATVMATASDSIVQLWDNTDTLKPTTALPLPRNSEVGCWYTARLHPSGRILATALSCDTATVLWDISDVAKPTILSTLPNTTHETNIVEFSPDGRSVLTGTEDNSLQLWDITEPAQPQRLSEPLRGFASFINDIEFSQDSRTIFAGSADHTVRSWDITDRNNPVSSGAAFTEHSGSVKSLSISPSGKTLATGSGDQTIRLWDITNPLHAVMIGGPLYVKGGGVQIAISPDGQTLVSGGAAIFFWNITGPAHPVMIGESLAPPRAVSISRLAFDPHGRLYVASQDGAIRIWNLDTTYATTRICATTQNVLTEQQWNKALPSLPYNPPCQQTLSTPS